MSGSRLGAALQVLSIVVLGALTGLAGGALWERSWTPPSGVVLSHEFVLDGQGLPEDFSGTGRYVLVAVAAGVVLGAVVGLLCRRRELVSLMTLLVAAALAGWLMARVGHSLGPPAPGPLAKDLPDWHPLPADLVVRGLAPYLSLPFGALLGLAAEFVLEIGIRGVRRPESEAVATLSV